MTKLSEFDSAEQQQILQAPRDIVMGAIVSDGSANVVGFFKELAAAGKILIEAESHANDFLKSIAKALDSQEAPAEGNEIPDAGATKKKALKEAKAAVALVREKADPADAEAYADWLIHVATKVAKASESKEGGFFSDKVRVAEGEKDFIADLKKAVGA